MRAENRQKNRDSPPNRDSRTCHKCGRVGHIAKECRAPEHVATIYRELRQLRAQLKKAEKPKQPKGDQGKSSTREVHSLDGPSLSNSDLENFLVSTRRLFDASPDLALIDSATTHSIFNNSKYFKFSSPVESWQECNLVTITGSQDFKYREGPATFTLSDGTEITCANAMYSPSAPRNLISYRDLRKNRIHVLTINVKGEEALALKRKDKVLITAAATANGLYGVRVRPIVTSTHNQLRLSLGNLASSAPRTVFVAGKGSLNPSIPTGSAPSAGRAHYMPKGHREGGVVLGVPGRQVQQAAIEVETSNGAPTSASTSAWQHMRFDISTLRPLPLFLCFDRCFRESRRSLTPKHKKSCFLKTSDNVDTFSYALP